MTYDHRRTAANIPIQARVTARFERTAALLTKQWLMGVRRGFLSILKPHIQDWDDVFKAFDALETFVFNFRQQVTRIRRGYSSWTSNDEDEGADLRKQFDALDKIIEDRRSAAKHWRDCYEDKIPFPSEEERGRGAQMLEIYRTKFQGALGGHIKGRGPHGQSTRYAEIEEIFDRVMKVLYADAKHMSQLHPTDQEDMAQEYNSEFTLGKAKIVVLDPNIEGTELSRYLRTCIECRSVLAKHGVEKDTWYGEIFIVTPHSYKLSQEEKDAYKANGYDIEGKLGDYSTNSNMVRIFAPSWKFGGTLLHELGHRYWYKKMTQTQRARFSEFVRTKETTPTWMTGDAEKDDKNKYEQKKGLINVDKLIDHIVRHGKKCAFDLERTLTSLVFIWSDAKPKTWLEYIDAIENSVSAGGARFIRGLYQGIGERSNDSSMPGEFPIIRKFGPWKAFERAADRCRDVIATEWRDLRAKLERIPVPDGDQKFFDEEHNKLKSITQPHAAAVRDAVQAATDALVDYVKAAREALPDARELEEKKVEPVTEYGGTNPSEAFAEAFEQFVGAHGAGMTSDQKESFKAVLQPRTASTSTTVDDSQDSLRVPRR